MMATLLRLLFVFFLGCDTASAPPPPPPPPPPPSPPPPVVGGPCDYDERVLPCLPHGVEVMPGGLTLHYRGVHGYEMSPVHVQVPDDQIERARRYYTETAATCTASVITRGSCPPILHASVAPPAFPAE